MKVGKVMCTDVQLIHPDETLRHAAALMKEIDAGALPVGEDDKLVGMVPKLRGKTDEQLVPELTSRVGPKETAPAGGAEAALVPDTHAGGGPALSINVNRS